MVNARKQQKRKKGALVSLGGFRRGAGSMEEGRYTLAPVVKPPREGLSLESLDPGSRPLQSPKQRGGAL